MNSQFHTPPSFTDKTKLHLCRHFKSIPDLEIQLLIQSGITLEEINKELSLQGSKFFTPPFESISTLIRYIIENWNSRIDNSETQDIITSTWSLSSELYPEGIGNDGLVNLSNLNEIEKGKVYKKDRKGILVNTYPTSSTIKTWNLVGVFMIKSNKLECVTIYPGTYAPPFPSESMDTKFFSVCSAFWNDHALVESIIE